MRGDKATADSVTKRELEAILDHSTFDVIRGDRGVVLALIPRGLSLQGSDRLLEYMVSRNKNLRRLS